jgi:hypothetical protein
MPMPCKVNGCPTEIEGTEPDLLHLEAHYFNSRRPEPLGNPYGRYLCRAHAREFLRFLGMPAPDAPEAGIPG